MSDLRKLGTADTKRMVEAFVKMNRTLFIHGSPGIGKSDIIRQIGREMGRDVYDVRLLLMTEVDVRGIPFYNAQSGKMEWAPPGVFPLEPDSNAIIFLDELTQASPSVQAAALQLTLDRKIGDFTVGDDVVILAAGNSASDKTGAKPLITALRNRFSHVEMKATADDWLEWAIENGVDETIVGYISHKKDHLYTFDASKADNAFATPRSWVLFVDKFLKSPDKLPEDLLSDAIAGAIGPGVALPFMALRKIMAGLPKAEEILAGQIKTLSNKDVNVQYSLLFSMIYQLREGWANVEAGKMKDTDWYAEANNFVSFGIENINAEIMVYGLRNIVGPKGFGKLTKVTVPAMNDAIKKYGVIMKHVS